MTLGQKIQISRKKKGMSQEDLANVLNVSRQAVQKWESDNSTPEINKLIDISSIFEVSLDWLLKDIEQKETKSDLPKYSGNPSNGVSTQKVISIVLISFHFGSIFLLFLLYTGILGLAYAFGYNSLSLIGYILLLKKEIRKKGTISFISLQVFASFGSLIKIAPFWYSAFYGLAINVLYIAGMILLYKDNCKPSGVEYSESKISSKTNLKSEKAILRQKLKESKNLQENYVNEIRTLKFRFLDQKYHPKDKSVVSDNASKAIYAIRHNVDEKEMKSILSTFDKYLKDFKLDPDYYVEFKKKQKKAYIITGIVVAGLGLLTGLTFATIKIVDTVSTNIETKERYDRACKFMEEGKFQEAGNAYRALGDYKDSKKMRNMNIYLKLIDDGVDLGSISTVKEGIEGIVKLGESVILRYDDKEGYYYYRKNFDEIDYYEVTVTSYPYIDYTPSVIKAGWKFKKWYPDRVFYKENQTYIELSATWEPIIYSIHYELNGGTNDIRNVETYNVATSTITLYNPIRDGWDFLNWTEESTGEIITEIPYGSTGNKNLIANWKVSA